MKVVKWFYVIMIVGLFTGSSWAADWPHYLGPNFDLKPLAKEFNAKSGTVVWEANVKTGMCSLTVANGLVYTMGNDGTKKDEDKTKARDFVYSLDAKSGQEKWTYNYSCLLEPRLHPGAPRLPRGSARCAGPPAEGGRDLRGVRGLARPGPSVCRRESEWSFRSQGLLEDERPGSHHGPGCFRRLYA